VIAVQTRFYGVLHDNTVTDVSGTGIRAYSIAGRLAGFPTFRHNLVRNCGGHGFDFARVYAELDSNRIEDVGLDGVHAAVGATAGVFVGNRIVRPGGAGIRLEDDAFALTGNVVLEAGSDGVTLAAAPNATRNVIGRCAGAGLRVTGGLMASSLQSNTVYLNRGSGFDVTGVGPPVSADHNIAFSNDGAGFRWSGAGAPALGCNDWCGNAGGATAGVPAGATDLDAAPAFCDLAADSVTLAANSPLASAPGCGQIGALGIGCGELLEVAGGRRRVATISAWPQPASGVVRLAWTALAGPALLEVFDAAGRRCWREALTPGTGALDWRGTDEAGRALPAGIYLARVLGAGRELRVRVVRIP
jgi:parallel beta helix pectate lyase-like protein